MKVSTRGRYGIRALLDIALHGQEGPVLIRDIAERQQISLLYLQHLLNPLIAGGLIRSIRGPGGGILLAKAPEDIKLSEIMNLLVGSVAPVECVNDPNVCARAATCATRDTWIEMKKSINSVLTSTTIQDLVVRQKKKNQDSQTSQASYQI
jgi:Rrf2 family transcriptional regulator, cysteine metabolism repressor